MWTSRHGTHAVNYFLCNVLILPVVMLYCWSCEPYLCAGCKCLVLIWWIVLLCQLYLLYCKLHWFIFTVNVYHSILWSVTVFVFLALFWLFCFYLIYITRVILVFYMIGWKPHDLTYPHRKPQCSGPNDRWRLVAWLLCKPTILHLVLACLRAWVSSSHTGISVNIMQKHKLYVDVQ
jgi:hypothetical protein